MRPLVKQSHVRDLLAFEERQPEDRLRDAGACDDLADHGHGFSRHAGNERRRCRSPRERPVLATALSVQACERTLGFAVPPVNALPIPKRVLEDARCTILAWSFVFKRAHPYSAPQHVVKTRMRRAGP